MNKNIPDLDTITRQLMSLEKPKKPKMLVVDDEPDNLDLLYRTFRRDFSVLKADSGISALEVLQAEGEVAVIISDQRMPEMKGTEFLSKTVPQFPDTVRIILTGFTDVEDLVDAINSGQVYKYITKPWDPGELKSVVQRAADSYELVKNKTDELSRAQAQTELLATIVGSVQEAQDLQGILNPIATAFAKSFACDACVLQAIETGNFKDAFGKHSEGEDFGLSLVGDSVVAGAIESQKLQVWVDASNAPVIADTDRYKAAALKAHLVVPVLYRSEVLAILSLQWRHPCKLSEDEVRLIHLSAQQVGLALTSARLS
ncbi:MAG: response regulator [Coleofasciculaceae cyanobacterium SM2_1_6]|nr:response regulator [Coleofasciculaceae cyanobacterium SM2_1_6]